MLSQTLHSNFHANCFEIVVKKRILSSSNASKATYFAKVGKNIHSNLLVQTKLSWKHLICFHFSTAGCKNTSKTKMLLKRCLVFQLGCSGLKYKLLLWFQTSLTQTSQLKKRCHPIWHLLCCPSPTKCLQMAFGAKKTWIPASTMSFCMKWSPLHNNIGLGDQQTLLSPNGPNCVVQSHVLAQLWYGFFFPRVWPMSRSGSVLTWA